MVLLRRNAKKELCKGNEIMPSESDRSFYPTPKDISNHMISQNFFLSKLDQQDLLHKVNEWKQEDKEASYYLRLYEMNLSDNKSVETQHFPFVSQESWQKRLIAVVPNSFIQQYKFFSVEKQTTNTNVYASLT